MDARTRALINKRLAEAGFDGNGRFPRVGHAHSAAFAVLAQYGYEPAGVLSGWETSFPQRRLILEIAKTNPHDPFSPEPVTNSQLIFAYSLLRPDAYEVVAYLS